LLKNGLIKVTLSRTKCCRGTLHCQQVCNRHAEYSARNNKRLSEIHWKLQWKRNHMVCVWMSVMFCVTLSIVWAARLLTHCLYLVM